MSSGKKEDVNFGFVGESAPFLGFVLFEKEDVSKFLRVFAI